jgi:N-acyl homoserine lactone hydrolase
MVLAPEAIVRLDLGHLWLPGLKFTIPVHGFLLKHPSGAGLVDTGYGSDGEILREYRAVAVPVAQALRKHDVDPSDIRWIINSHLHFDHCGQNAVFPHAPLYVQRGEYERRDDPDYTVVEWANYSGAQWELLDGEREIVPGVSVLTTPGHTPGHQSIRIDTTEGPAIMTGDACWTVGTFNGASLAAGTMEDVLTAERSLEKLRQLKPVSVHFCHDNRTWRSNPVKEAKARRESLPRNSR